MGVFPDFDGLGGIGDLKQVIGALLMFVLIVAVLMVIVSVICWALGASHGNHSLASKGRVGVLVGVGAAALRQVATNPGRRDPRRTRRGRRDLDPAGQPHRHAARTTPGRSGRDLRPPASRRGTARWDAVVTDPGLRFPADSDDPRHWARSRHRPLLRRR